MEIQWSLVLFTVIAGAGSWLFSASMIGALAKKGPLPGKVESILAFVLLVVGGLASVTHLKHVDRIMEALNRPTSGIFVEAAFVGVLCALIAVYFIMLLRGTGERPRRVVGIVTMVLGIAFAYACGSSYLMAARGLWMTYALPLAYCATAGIGGCGLNLLLRARAAGALGGADAGEGEAAEGEAAKGAKAASGAASGGASGGEVAFAGLLVLVVAVLSLIFSLAFTVPAWSTIAADGTTLAWAIFLFAGIIIAGAAGALAWKRPAGSTVSALAVTVAGIVAALALRAVMWLIGTPLMDFFLMPME